MPTIRNNLHKLAVFSWIWKMDHRKREIRQHVRTSKNVTETREQVVWKCSVEWRLSESVPFMIIGDKLGKFWSLFENQVSDFARKWNRQNSRENGHWGPCLVPWACLKCLRFRSKVKLGALSTKFLSNLSWKIENPALKERPQPKGTQTFLNAVEAIQKLET